MKNINVVAAIIREGDQILATQRGTGEFAGGWEFPGGKIELDETSEEAIIREIKEELGVEIRVDDYVYTVEYDYPNFHLHMECYFATIVKGELRLTEHSAAKWLTRDTLHSVEWLPADIDLVQRLQEIL